MSTARSLKARTGPRRGYFATLTIIATLGGLLFGYDTGVISGALLYLNDALHLNAVETGTVVSVLLFPGAALGALFGGPTADRLGRRSALWICAGLFLIGAGGSALAPNFGVIVVARIVLGLGVGAASVICPLYLAEMAPAERRGRMVTINELMIVSGQLLAFVINAVLDSTVTDATVVWRYMLGVAAIPAIALLVGLFFLPESPRWFARRGDHDAARRVLALGRPASEVDIELDEIERTAAVARSENGHVLKDLAQNAWMRRLLFIGMGLAAVQQATGINTVNYYAPTILKSTGLGNSAALVDTIAVGVTSVVMTLLGIWLLGFVGRKKMLVTGFIGVASSQALLSLAFLLPDSGAKTGIILAAMLLFVAFVQCFIGTGVWLLLSEIFPLAIRGFAMGVSVFTLWFVNSLISWLFPIVNAALGSTGTFALFVVINIASIFFVWRTVPETNKRTLESLEAEFRGVETTAVTTVYR